MRYGFRQLLATGRSTRQILEELRGIRFALERIAGAAEKQTGVNRGVFRGSLQRPGELPDESAITDRNPELLRTLDALEQQMTKTLGRIPTLDELDAEAERRELM